MEVTRERIIKILFEYLPGLRAEVPLISQLDSLAIIQLVSALEREFEVQIAAHELDLSVFESVESLTALMDQKKKSSVE